PRDASRVAGGSAAPRWVDGQGELRNREPRPLLARMPGAAWRPRSCGGWRCVHDEFGGDREFADAPAGCVEDGIGDRGCSADLADLTDTFHPERIDAAVFDFDELDPDLGSVGVDGDEILAKTDRSPAPVPGIHRVALQQGLAQTPEHPAHELAARELRIEHSSGGEDAEHAPDTYEAQIRIDGDLRELRTERQQPT